MSNTSFRQGLPESRSQGWQDPDHIHVSSATAPCVALPPASLQSWIPAVHAGMTCYLSKVIGGKPPLFHSSSLLRAFAVSRVNAFK
ncbi:MAG: hypothetical protein Q8L79_05495 [Methylobacter sp.]|uniref:hypothetical protein n=1 Tax=Methylobacter sp. TaxID=2051955 RepID=UPI002730E84E|nr:hypothetical protein [Methylobacter sp.]MDP1664565.1 hypothetical protein [Methylobacter sp.]